LFQKGLPITIYEIDGIGGDFNIYLPEKMEASCLNSLNRFLYDLIQFQKNMSEKKIMMANVYFKTSEKKEEK